MSSKGSSNQVAFDFLSNISLVSSRPSNAPSASKTPKKSKSTPTTGLSSSKPSSDKPNFEDSEIKQKHQKSHAQPSNTDNSNTHHEKSPKKTSDQYTESKSKSSGHTSRSKTKSQTTEIEDQSQRAALDFLTGISLESTPTKPKNKLKTSLKLPFADNNTKEIAINQNPSASIPIPNSDNSKPNWLHPEEITSDYIGKSPLKDSNYNYNQYGPSSSHQDDFLGADYSSIMFGQPPTTGPTSSPSHSQAGFNITADELAWKNSVLSATTVISGKEFASAQRRVLRHVTSGYRVVQAFPASRASHRLSSHHVSHSHQMADTSHPQHEYSAFLISSLIVLDKNPKYNSNSSSSASNYTNQSQLIQQEKSEEEQNQENAVLQTSLDSKAHDRLARFRIGNWKKSSSVSYQHLIHPTARSITLNAEAIASFPIFSMPSSVTSSNDIFSPFESSKDTESTSPQSASSSNPLKRVKKIINPRILDQESSSNEIRELSPRTTMFQNQAIKSAQSSILNDNNQPVETQKPLDIQSTKYVGSLANDDFDPSSLPHEDTVNTLKALEQLSESTRTQQNALIIQNDQEIDNQLKDAIRNQTSQTNSVPTHNSNISPYERCLQHYDPDFLDNDIERPDKYKIPVCLPGYNSSLIPFIASKVVRQEENTAFVEKHLWIKTDISLSKIRSVKRKLEQTAISQSLDIACAAHSFAYFEKLVLRNLVQNSTARLYGAICLLLAAKYYGVKVNSYSGLIKELENRLDVAAKEILANEFFIYKELKFCLFLEADEVMPHFIKLKSSQAFLDKEFYVKQKERQRHQKKKYQQERERGAKMPAIRDQTSEPAPRLSSSQARSLSSSTILETRQ